MNKISNKAIYAARTVLLNHSLHGVNEIKPEDMYIVWFCKTLQNWKALVSGVYVKEYIEVTYNGDGEEAYIDVYQRAWCECIKDGDDVVLDY